MGRYHGVLDIYQQGVYYRALLNNQFQPVLFRVQSDYTGIDSGALTAELVYGDERPNLINKLAYVLALDTNLMPFYELAQNDPTLWTVVQPFIGLRHLQSETVFEALIQVIIEQQISLYAALRAQQALVESYGQEIIFKGRAYYTFPTPQVIASANAEELHKLLKITRRRVALIQQIATQVSEGTLDLECMRHSEAISNYHRLMGIKGVGHWTAAWTLIRGLNSYQFVGHNDVALRDAVAHFFFKSNHRVSAEQVAETFQQYGDYAGLAGFYTLMRWAVDHY